MSQSIDPFRAACVVAVLRGPSGAATVEAVDTLVTGGITAIEITYSTPDAVNVIAEVRHRHGDEVLLGAGTVTNGEQARAAVDAGATFLVSPGSREGLAREMVATGAVTFLGALTPSEVLDALAWGADVVKVFPASLGGPAYLKSLRGPFPDVAFCPTGGVNPATIPEWLDAGAVAVGAGSELCSTADIAAARWDEISSRARAFVEAARR